MPGIRIQDRCSPRWNIGDCISSKRLHSLTVQESFRNIAFKIESNFASGRLKFGLPYNFERGFPVSLCGDFVVVFIYREYFNTEGGASVQSDTIALTPAVNGKGCDFAMNLAGNDLNLSDGDTVNSNRFWCIRIFNTLKGYWRVV